MSAGEFSINITGGGLSSSVAVTGTSAQSAAFASTGPGTSVVISPTVPMFVRQGVNPVALANGTDLYLLGGVSYRTFVAAGNKLAFIAAGASGGVYITPNA